MAEGTDRGAARHARQRRADPLQQGRHIARLIAHMRVDHFTIRMGDRANLEQSIDKKPQAELRRNPPRRDMRAAQQAEIFKILHHVTDRRRRNAF